MKDKELQNFDYSKLRGRIIEKYGTICNFANALEKTPTTMSRYLKNKEYIPSNVIFKCCNLLDIDYKDIAIYFFNQSKKKTRTEDM